MGVVGTGVDLATKRGDFAGGKGTAAGEASHSGTRPLNTAVTCKAFSGNLEIIRPHYKSVPAEYAAGQKLSASVVITYILNSFKNHFGSERLSL